jgi:penicillin-binding protein 1A
VISEQISFLVSSALNSAIWGEKGTKWLGTGWRAMQSIKRSDISGKSGTTNNAKDAWFSGFGPGLVTTTWLGFDQPHRALGYVMADPNLQVKLPYGVESGAKSAQPAWNQFMKLALQNTPLTPSKIPSGIHSLRINPKTGKSTSPNDKVYISEYFLEGNGPSAGIPEDYEYPNFLE